MAGPEKQPEAAKATMAGRVASESHERKLAEGAERYRALTIGDNGQNLEQLFFGNPQTPEGSFMYQQWERLNAQEGYGKEKEWVMMSMRKAAEKIFAALKARAEKEQLTSAETGEKLKALDAYLRTVGVIGQSLKTKLRNPYEPGRQIDVQSTREVMDKEEAVLLRQFADNLDRIDPQEVIDMVLENQLYITMLIELKGMKGRPIADVLPKGYSLQHTVTAASGSKNAGQRIAMLSDDYREQFEGKDKKDNKYLAKLDHLRRLILGEKEPNAAREKSEERKRTEMTLWLEIVSNMDPHQKKDLVQLFIDENGVAGAERFMRRAIYGGAMTKEEAVHFIVAPEDKAAFARLHEKDGGSLEKTLDRAVRDGEKVRAVLQEAASEIGQNRIENAAAHFLTINKLVIGRVAELGALTALVNAIITVAVRIGKRSEHNEKLPEALVKGIGQALTDKFVIGGAAVAATASNSIFPWIKGVILRPSREEKLVRAKDAGTQYILAELARHPHAEGVEEAKDMKELSHRNISAYFITHYDRYLAIANKNGENPDRKNDRSLWPGDGQHPGDVKLSREEAGKLGYDNAQEATAALYKFFQICGPKGFNFENEDQVAKYFIENIYPEHAHLHHNEQPNT